MAMTAQLFSSISYDYLIAGGGTAGLVLAARLSSNPTVNVGVIEAGIDHTNDPSILTPLDFLSLRENPVYDWNYTTVPQVRTASHSQGMELMPTQVNLTGQNVPQARGKGLGGSSAINYMMFTHAAKADIDDWAALGNPGWNWDTLDSYYKKFETYEAPPPEISNEIDATYINASVHGNSGPIHGSFSPFYTDIQRAWTPTYKGLGIGFNGDMRDGVSQGGYTNLVNQNQGDHSRSYSANGYYTPNKDRPNLKVLTSAFVNNVLFDPNNKSKGLVATGLNFTVNGSHFIVNATKEIVICGGVINSPQILELSGIGNPDILNKYGIPVLYENKNVGENLQDHPQIRVANQVNDGVITLDQYFNKTFRDEARQLYNTNRTGMLTSGVTQNAPLSWSQVLLANQQSRPQQLVNQFYPGPYEVGKPGVAEQFALYAKRLLDPTETYVCETMFAGTGSAPTGPDPPLYNYVGRTAFLTRAFSRGSSHINSVDPLAYPDFDPKYMSHPLDIEMLADAALHMQRVGQSPPLSFVFKGNGTVYGKDFPSGLTDENVRDYIRKFLVTGWHPIGTCSMQPEGKGGVVSPRLVVYGTTNLRVVDASIAPLHVRGNTQTMTYAIAEYGADLIKEDHGE
ncbi:MAG: hypothetical protein M1814_006211 [Vezdaea aestivalis]|nr:MAG: hypothetical protein M1814_006211 [Vezdaea aestivalis]